MADIVMQQVLNTFILAGIYAALAVGLTLIFGTMRLIQFAHGEVCLLGAFASLPVVNNVGNMNSFTASMTLVLLGFIVSGGTGACLGWLLERWAFRPLQARSPVQTLVVSLGLAIVIRESLAILWPDGRNPQPFLPSLSQSVFLIGGISIGIAPFLLAIAGFLSVFLADLFTKKTRTGLAARAIAQDYEAAFMVGIPVFRIQRRLFVLASTLAGIAGFMIGISYGSIRYDIGLTLVLKGFTAAVLGGMNSVRAAALGALGLATIETLAIVFLPNGSTFRDTISFVLLTLVLIVRPGGLTTMMRNSEG